MNSIRADARHKFRIASDHKFQGTSFGNHAQLSGKVRTPRRIARSQDHHTAARQGVCRAKQIGQPFIVGHQDQRRECMTALRRKTHRRSCEFRTGELVCHR